VKLLGLPLALLMFVGVIAAPKATPADFELPGPLAALAQVIPAAAAPTSRPTVAPAGAGAVIPPAAVTNTAAPNPPAYTVSGKVTSSTTGGAIARVTVSVRAADTLAVVASATTDGAGNYATRVPRGSYKVEFRPAAGFTSEWWNNKGGASKANILNVEGSARAGINASLTPR
jgi:hypothetical protein